MTSSFIRYEFSKDRVDSRSLCFLHGYCLFILFFVQPSAFRFWLAGMTVLSLVAAVPALRCRTTPVLTGLLGSLFDWPLAVVAASASQPVSRTLAALLGSRHAPRSPRGLWQCETSAGKQLCAAHEGQLCAVCLL